MAVAAAFFITGTLGSILAIPPSYATVIFPPSGIAVAAILLYGNRMAWGILLGAFLHNAIVPLIASDFSISLNSAPISLAIASGATLQAFVAAYLVRRFAGKPDILSSKKNILLFLFYGGIVGALVNSTFSVSLLVATGGMPAEVFLINWLSWWSGDALGIIIFAPLVIIWLSEHNPIWQDKKWAITLPIITLFSLTIGAVFYETETSNARIKMELEQRTKELSTLIETSINADLKKLQSLNSLYDLSKTISRAEFHTFVRASFGNFQGVQSIQWAPIILATNRNDYEKSVRLEG
ncbi:MAG: MASE1 domain-containing protein, partial [Methylococcaceae bacterium]